MISLCLGCDPHLCRFIFYLFVINNDQIRLRKPSYKHVDIVIQLIFIEPEISIEIVVKFPDKILDDLLGFQPGFSQFI